jgi:hypothetical protein
VLLRLGRRVIYSGVAFFALLGFVSVPLGQKTGWAHIQAIAATPAATRAVDEFKSSVAEWEHRLVGWLTSRFHSTTGTLPIASAREGIVEDSVPRMPQKHTQLGSVPVPKPPSLIH